MSSERIAELQLRLDVAASPDVARFYDEAEGPWDDDIAMFLALTKRLGDWLEHQRHFLNNEMNLCMQAQKTRTAAQAEATKQTQRVRELARWIQELADEPCRYGDNCPPFVPLNHGRCLHCKARTILEEKADV